MSLFNSFGKPEHEALYIFTDGATRRIPPASASAVVIKDGHGQVIQWFSRLLPPLTSMEAEYYGLLDGLMLAGKLRPAKAYLHLDNQAVAGQAAGKYRVREPRLKRLHTLVEEQKHKLAAAQIALEIYFIPREYNLLADALAADTLLPVLQKQKLEVKGDSSE